MVEEGEQEIARCEMAEMGESVACCLSLWTDEWWRLAGQAGQAGRGCLLSSGWMSSKFAGSQRRREERRGVEM
jgi:hypothetical protein